MDNSFKKINISALIKSKIFLRVFLSYLLVLTIPVIINFATHSASMKVIRDNSVDYSMRQLLEIMRSVDNGFLSLWEVSQQVSGDSIVKRLMNARTYDNTPFIEFDKCIPTVQNYMNSKKKSESITYNNYYLFFRGYDYVMLPDTLYSPELYHKARVLNFNNLNSDSYEKWRRLIDSQYFSDTYIFNDYENYGYPENTDSIIYVRTISDSFNSNARGTLVVDVPKRYIRTLFLNVQDESSFSYIEDADGNRVLSVGNSKFDNISIDFDSSSGFKRIIDRNAIATYTVSNKTGWRYVTLTPEVHIYSSLMYIQKTYMWIIAVIGVLGITVALFFSRSNTQPIISATETLSGYFGGDKKNDPYNLITVGVTKLVSDQISLQKDLNEQKPYMKDSLIGGLLDGHLYTDTELSSILKYLDLPMQSNEGYYVVLIRLYSNKITLDSKAHEDLREILAWKIVVRSAIAHQFSDVLLHDVDQKRIALIFNLAKDPTEFKKYLNEGLDRANTELQNAFNMHFFAASSSFCRTLNDLWRGFQQAERALQYTWNENNIAFYDDLKEEDNVYYYPSEIEKRLLVFSKAGEFSQIEQNLNLLYHENIVRRNLAIHIGHELIVEMRSTLKRLAQDFQDMSLHEKINSINNQKPISESFAEIQCIYKVICKLANNEKKNSTKMFVKDVTTYMYNNFNDSEMSLRKIASHFNFSESYFSSFFKDNIGMNFIDYLEEIRMEKAIQLLKTTNMTIDAIATAIGYNSDHSFRRAFKKVYGCSPAQMR